MPLALSLIDCDVQLTQLFQLAKLAQSSFLWLPGESDMSRVNPVCTWWQLGHLGSSNLCNLRCSGSSRWSKYKTKLHNVHKVNSHTWASYSLFIMEIWLLVSPAWLMNCSKRHYRSYRRRASGSIFNSTWIEKTKTIIKLWMSSMRSRCRLHWAIAQLFRGSHWNLYNNIVCESSLLFTLCCVGLHQPHNHISPHCITVDQPSPRHLILACLHLVTRKPGRCLFCTLFATLTFEGQTNVLLSVRQWTPHSLRGQKVDLQHLALFQCLLCLLSYVFSHKRDHLDFPF